MSVFPSYNEPELFSRIAEGDEQAFNELYFHLQPVLLGFIIKILKSDTAVMEVMQESLLRFWLQRDKLPDIEFPRSYLFKIVSNECFRYLHKKGIEQKRVAELQEHHHREKHRNCYLVFVCVYPSGDPAGRRNYHPHQEKTEVVLRNSGMFGKENPSAFMT